MRKSLKLFKKVTCILGIAFLGLGMIPLPGVIQFVPTPEAAAAKPAGETSALSPANFNGLNVFDDLLGRGDSSLKDDGEACNNDNDCKSDNCYQHVCRTPVNCVGDYGPCSVDCGGGTKTFHITTPAQYGGDSCSHNEGYTRSCNTDPCITLGGDDTTCKPNGDSCEESDECCSGNCNGVNGKCADPNSQCKGEGGPCGGANVCCAGLVCITDPTTESDKCGYACSPKTAEEVCPTECGYEGGNVDDGCGGTVTCAATEACCTPGGQELCPTDCGYEGGCVDDGCGGTVDCAATEACCTPGGQELCPTQCGYEGGNVDDGCGGTVKCSATEDCCEPGGQELCPTQCDYAGGTVDDGCGGTVQCEATEACCTPYTTDICPTECGYPGGELSDGCGGIVTCEATFDCEGTCPDYCGYPGGDEVPDGKGGVIVCQPVAPPAAETCPTDCGYEGGEVPDGQCGYTQCAPVEPPAEEQCTNLCGYDGGTVPDGQCGEKECDSTAKCQGMVLDPYCSTKAGVGGVLVWEIQNSGSAPMAVNWTLDGQAGSAVIAAGTTLGVGQTTDGPDSHTLTANWQGGSDSVSSSRVCEKENPTPPGPPIPVTGAGGGQLIIPVTGIDMSFSFNGLQKMFTYMGLMLFGITMVLEGVDQKRRKFE